MASGRVSRNLKTVRGCWFRILGVLVQGSELRPRVQRGRGNKTSWQDTVYNILFFELRDLSLVDWVCVLGVDVWGVEFGA